MPVPATNAASEPQLNTPLRKNRSGSSASSPMRRSASRNATTPTSPIR